MNSYYIVQYTTNPTEPDFWYDTEPKFDASVKYARLAARSMKMYLDAMEEEDVDKDGNQYIWHRIIKRTESDEIVEEES